MIKLFYLKMNKFDFNDQIISKLDSYSESGSNACFKCGSSSGDYTELFYKLGGKYSW